MKYHTTERRKKSKEAIIMKEAICSPGKWQLFAYN